MPDVTPGAELTVEDRMASLESQLGQLINLVTDMAGGDENDASADASTDLSAGVESISAANDLEEEEEVIAATADNANAILLSRLATVEAELAAEREAKSKAVYANGCPIGAKFTLTQGVADLLYESWRKDPSALDALKASIVKDEAPAPQTVAAPITLTSAWADSGIADDSAEPAKVTKATAMADARILATQNKTSVTDEYRKQLKAMPKMSTLEYRRQLKNKGA